MMMIKRLRLTIRPRVLYGALPILCFGLAFCSTEKKSGPPGVRDASSEEAVVLMASDGISVYGTLFRPEADGPTPLILAFHQGGASGLAEYEPSIPRLLSEGYAVFVIDQRRGGDRFEGVNRTATEFANPDISYCDVYPDLETALDFGLRLPGVSDIIAWGSSYSATLVAQLAVDYPGAVTKIVAFSPASGDAMDGCRAVPIAEQIQIPALFVRPASELEIESVAQDFAAFEALGHETVVAEPGAHGSSALVPERAGGDTESLWLSVLTFMRSDNPIDR